MNKELEAYKAWAPPESPWSLWAKPVLFAPLPPEAAMILSRIDRQPAARPGEAGDSMAAEAPECDWLRPSGRKTAIIIDLPGPAGVAAGLAAARAGYRPIPLYNGVRYHSLGPVAVEVESIVEALFAGAEELRRTVLRPEAPPAFLLDANRMRSSSGTHGIFDNRWSVFPQDLPSAAFLIGRGINELLVRAAGLQDDLAHVLYRYQLAGLKVKLFDGQFLKDHHVAKPSRFGSLMYRFMVCLGLKPHAGGGFGGLVPMPGEGGARGIG